MACEGDLMATFKFEGVNELINQYKKLEGDTDKIIGRAVYEGAHVVVKACENAVASLDTDDGFGTNDKPLAGPSTIQKIGLMNSLGVAKMRNENGFVNVKIGFDGYNRVKTHTWPNGQPNILVARSVESGTSWMRKQPFMRKATQVSKAPCERAMSETVDKEIQKIVGD